MPKDSQEREASSRAGFSAAEIRAGALACLALAPSVGVFGAVLGVLAVQKGLTLVELVVMGVLVFAGSAQFVVVDLWRESVPVVAILTATVVINLRYLLICASLRSVFAEQGLVGKLAGIHFTADENWAVTMARPVAGSPGYLLGGGLCLGAVWVASTALGHALGGGVPDPARFGLDFTFTAIFLALVVSLFKGRGDLLPWSAAALAALAAEQWLPGRWYVVVGALVGMGVSAACWPGRPSATEARR